MRCFNFTYRDRLKGRYCFCQTSGQIFRNVYHKFGGPDPFDRVFTLPWPQSFCGDGFRLNWFLKTGKAHYVNQVESVYNIDGEGIWSSASEGYRLLRSARALYNMALFFADDAPCYLSEARQQLQRYMWLPQQHTHTLPAEEHELLVQMYRALYPLPDAPQPARAPRHRRLLKLLIKLVPLKRWRRYLRDQYVYPPV